MDYATVILSPSLVQLRVDYPNERESITYEKTALVEKNQHGQMPYRRRSKECFSSASRILDE